VHSRRGDAPGPASNQAGPRHGILLSIGCLRSCAGCHPQQKLIAVVCKRQMIAGASPTSDAKRVRLAARRPAAVNCFQTRDLDPERGASARPLPRAAMRACCRAVCFDACRPPPFARASGGHSIVTAAGASSSSAPDCPEPYACLPLRYLLRHSRLLHRFLLPLARLCSATMRSSSGPPPTFSSSWKTQNDDVKWAYVKTPTSCCRNILSNLNN